MLSQDLLTKGIERVQGREKVPGLNCGFTVLPYVSQRSGVRRHPVAEPPTLPGPS